MTVAAVAEICLHWLNKFTLDNKSYWIDFGKLYRVINRNVSYKGCQRDYKSCPPMADPPMVPRCGPAPSTSCYAKSGGGGGERPILEILENIREPVADYQEKRGLPKNEQYGFINLTTSLAQQAYNAILVILTMLYNLLPLLEGFSYLLRFVLDKLIEICRADEKTDKVIKITLFIAELIVIFVIVSVICGFILLPVWYLFSHMFTKIWNMVLSTGS